MHKPVRFRAAKSVTATTKPEKAAVDKWMQRAVWTVQLLLFPLAILGYIFTVRPVYQKQLVDEKIAEQTVLFRNAKVAVDRLTAEQVRLTKENAVLAQDAEVTYSSLRRNLMASLPSTASSCAYISQLEGNAIYSCVAKEINEKMLPLLRSADRIKLSGALLANRSEIVNIVNKTDQDQRQGLSEIVYKLDRLERQSATLPRDLIVKIQKMRNDTGPVPKTIKALGQMQTPDEINAYLDMRDKSEDIMFEILKLSHRKSSIKMPLSSKISDELNRILRKVQHSMGNG